MGIYLNPGNENFKEMINADIYVDKTMMISVINKYIDKGNKYLCISRPRRFGKTIAGNMLSAYYSKGCDSRELFKGLKICDAPDFEKKLGKYNVIKLDLNSEYQNTENTANLIKIISEKIKSEMKNEFPYVTINDSDSLAESILNVFSETGETFIIIIDEYDVLVREQADEELFAKYLSFLNGLFKSDTLRPAISLAYLTGILPVVRDKIQSKLNNFKEYTILDAQELTEFIGFTDDEVRELCREYGMDYDECKSWYDGYTQNGYEIYNPESVVESMLRKKYGSYWGRTSTYEAIAERIRMNFSGTKDAVIRMLAGEEVDINVTGYMNTMTSFKSKNDLFTYLMHIGYLAYNDDESTCRIPNREVRQEWFNAIETEPEYEVTNRIIESSRALLKAAIAGDSDTVAKALDTSHIHVSSNRSYNNEDVLQSAIYLSFIFALNTYTCVREMTAGRGFSDVTYIPIHPAPERPAMIIELKKNGSPDSAIDQIKERRYFDSLEHYQGNLLFVGISYDEKEKTHTCRIERFEK
ncbi:MAG TPA: AAA family ATPase [Lachnospiraceae bacterium]|nr:AAA family ATPase [Lachnospiraceae bacterium]